MIDLQFVEEILLATRADTLVAREFRRKEIRTTRLAALARETKHTERRDTGHHIVVNRGAEKVGQ